MLFAFDLDGTLIDNLRAVRYAYDMAGVKMPLNAWGAPFNFSLCTPKQHDEKNLHYPDALRRYARPGPALPLWHALGGDSVVITGASETGARAALAFLGLVVPESHLYTGLTTAKKIDLLRRWHAESGAVYVDSDPAICMTVKEHVSCHIVCPAPFHT